jgi:hypothetical protein
MRLPDHPDDGRAFELAHLTASVADCPGCDPRPRAVVIAPAPDDSDLLVVVHHVPGCDWFDTVRLRHRTLSVVHTDNEPTVDRGPR